MINRMVADTQRLAVLEGHVFNVWILKAVHECATACRVRGVTVGVRGQVVQIEQQIKRELWVLYEGV